jgi:SNF2 family DNA or RNA helicase
MNSKPLKPLWYQFSYFDHQIEGINWMLKKEREGTIVPSRNEKTEVTVRGGLQCDDMGLGKTIQVIATITHNQLPKTLLFAPLAMIQTWTDVCLRAGIIVYHAKNKEWVQVTTTNTSIPMYLMRKRPAIYITNYEKIYSAGTLFQGPWDRIVLDEAHKIRNGSGYLSYKLRKIPAACRWAVTGTPLVNKHEDIVSLLAFIGVPFSPLFKWESRYMASLPHLLIHRTLDSLRSVIISAPPVPLVFNEVLDFTTEEEEEFYYGIQGATKDLLKYSGDAITSSAAFKLLLRLRQISVHPQVYINAKRREAPFYLRKNWHGSSTKISKIEEIIHEESDDGELHKYIIFCQFNDEMELIHDYLSMGSLIEEENILMYNGSMNEKQRTAVLKKSKESDKLTVMLIQLQAGGVGLNLQEYDRIIFVSPYWTAALMDQAVARAVRMGQTKQVHVYHLLLEAEQSGSINIDELINSKAEEKRYMLNEIFDRCADYIEDNKDEDADINEDADEDADV